MKGRSFQAPAGKSPMTQKPPRLFELPPGKIDKNMAHARAGRGIQSGSDESLRLRQGPLASSSLAAGRNAGARDRCALLASDRPRIRQLRRPVVRNRQCSRSGRLELGRRKMGLRKPGRGELAPRYGSVPHAGLRLVRPGTPGAPPGQPAAAQPQHGPGLPVPSPAHRYLSGAASW